MTVEPHSASLHVAHAKTGPAVGLMLAAMLAFAAMDAISKILATQLAIPQILWVRYIFFTLLAAAMLRRTGLIGALRSQQPWLQFWRALLIVVENGVFVLAFTLMPLADMHAIAAASPLIVVALSVPLLGEKVGPRRWIAVGAGFLGVLLIVRPGFEAIDWRMAIALTGTLMWAVYQIMVRLCARTDSSETTWAWTAVVGLGATTLVGPFYWVWPDAHGWALLAGICVLGSLAHLAFIKAFAYAEAGALQPYSYTLLIWAAVVGYLVFGDIPDAWTIAGAIVIMASGLYAWHRERVLAAAVHAETASKA